MGLPGSKPQLNLLSTYINEKLILLEYNLYRLTERISLLKLNMRRTKRNCHKSFTHTTS